MGTRWSVTCDTAPDQDREWLHEALQATVEQVDAQMSPWKPDSDLVRLNREEVGTWVELPAEPLQVLARALEINRLSAGAFDPALGDLVDAWGFGPVRDAPDAAAIRAARDQDRGPAHQRLELDLGAGRARKRAPVQLAPCGIAKGYAVDRMVDALRRPTAWRTRWWHWMANCAPWAARRTASPGRWRWRAPRTGAGRCTA